MKLVGKTPLTTYEAARARAAFTPQDLKRIEEFRIYGQSNSLRDTGSNITIPGANSSVNSTLSNLSQNQDPSIIRGGFKVAYLQNGFKQEQVAYADSGINIFLERFFGNQKVKREQAREYLASDPFRQQALKGLGDPDIKAYYKAISLGTSVVSPVAGATLGSVLDIMDYEDQLKLRKTGDIAKPSTAELFKVGGLSFAENLAMAKISQFVIGKYAQPFVSKIGQVGTQYFSKQFGKTAIQTTAATAQGISNLLTAQFYRLTATDVYKTGRELSLGNKYTALTKGVEAGSGLLGFYSPQIYGATKQAVGRILTKVKLTEVTFNEPGRGKVTGYIAENVALPSKFKSGKMIMPGKQIDIGNIPKYERFYSKNLGRWVYVKRAGKLSFKKPSTWIDKIRGYKPGQIKQIRYQVKGKLLLKETPSQLSDPLTQIMLGKKGPMVIASVSPGRSAFGRKKEFEVKEMPGLSTILRSFAGGAERGFFFGPPEKGTGIPQAYSYYAGLGKGKANLYDYLTSVAKAPNGKPSIILAKEKIEKIARPLLEKPVTAVERAEVNKILSDIRLGKYVDKGLTPNDANRLLKNYKSVDKLALHRRLALALNIPGKIVPGVGALSGLRTEYEVIAGIGTKFRRFAGKFKTFFGSGDYKIFLPKEKTAFDVIIAEKVPVRGEKMKLDKQPKKVIATKQEVKDVFVQSLVQSKQAVKIQRARQLEAMKPSYTPRGVQFPGLSISYPSRRPSRVSVSPGVSRISRASLTSFVSGVSSLSRVSGISTRPSGKSVSPSYRQVSPFSISSVTSFKSPTKSSKASGTSTVSPPKEPPKPTISPFRLLLPPTSRGRVSRKQKRKPTRYSLLPTITQQLYRIKRKGGPVRKPRGFEIARI